MMITLKDGRKLAWYEVGPSSGKPLLFCTGAAMSGSLMFGEEELLKQNFRLISIDRPGLGLSTPDPKKTLLSWNSDVQELIDQLKLDSPSAVGFSQGSVFAFSLASQGLAKSLAIVSGQDDFNDPKTKAQLSEQVLPFISMIQSRNQEFIEGFKKNLNPIEFLNFIIAMSSDVDKEIYCKEPFYSQYQKSLEAGLKQGADHYILDLINAMSAWPFKLEDIKVPVHLWYGGKDTSTVHSPDFGKRMYSRIPSAHYHFLENEGGSLLWTRSREILEKLNHD